MFKILKRKQRDKQKRKKENKQKLRKAIRLL